MKEELRIKSKKEFDEFFKLNQIYKNNYFIIYTKPKKEKYVRIGIAISNKFGNAVKRNHYKRILRNIIRINYDNFCEKFDYIILIRKSCDTIKYIEIEKEVKKLLQRVK